MLVVVTARSYSPLPVTSEVTSTLTQFAELNCPDEPITPPSAGAFAYVNWLSSHALPITLFTW